MRLEHVQLVGDSRPQLGDVTDDADGPASLPQGVKDGHHLLEAFLVQRAEASSTNNVCRSKPPASARTASPIASANAREAMNASPPDSEDVSRVCPVQASL